MRVRPLVRAVGALVVFTQCLPAQQTRDRERDRREAMVALIARSGVRDSATLAAMRTVPRHEFVPVDDRELAYGDFPLPIG